MTPCSFLYFTFRAYCLFYLLSFIYIITLHQAITCSSLFSNVYICNRNKWSKYLKETNIRWIEINNRYIYIGEIFLQHGINMTLPWSPITVMICEYELRPAPQPKIKRHVLWTVIYSAMVHDLLSYCGCLVLRFPRQCSSWDGSSPSFLWDVSFWYAWGSNSWSSFSMHVVSFHDSLEVTRLSFLRSNNFFSISFFWRGNSFHLSWLSSRFACNS